MSTPNITTLTPAYVGSINARGGALINQTPDAGGLTGQSTTWSFLGVPSGGTIGAPATLAQLTVARPNGQSSAASFGQLMLSTNNGSGAILPIFSATQNGFVSDVTIFNSTYDTTSGSAIFKSGGTTALTLSSSSAIFGNQISAPLINLTGSINQIASTNTLTTTVGGMTALSVTSGGAITLLGATAYIDSTNSWTLKQGGISYITIGSSQVSLSTTAQLYVPNSILVSGTVSSTKFLVQDATPANVFAVDTSAGKAVAKALQITSLSAGFLTADSSGNVTSSGSGLSFNNTTLTGITTFTGTLVQSGGSAVTFNVAPSALGLTLTNTASLINTTGTSLALQVGGISYVTLGSNTSTFSKAVNASQGLTVSNGSTLIGATGVFGNMQVYGAGASTTQFVVSNTAGTTAYFTVDTSTPQITIGNATLVLNASLASNISLNSASTYTIGSAGTPLNNLYSSFLTADSITLAAADLVSFPVTINWDLITASNIPAIRFASSLNTNPNSDGLCICPGVKDQTAADGTVTYRIIDNPVVSPPLHFFYDPVELRSTLAFEGTNVNTVLQNTTGGITGASALTINSAGGNSNNALSLVPGYKGSTSTTGVATYSLPSGGTHYFNNAIELGGAAAFDSTLNFNNAFSGSTTIASTTSGTITLPQLTPYCYYFYAATMAANTSSGTLTLPGTATIRNIMYITGNLIMNWNSTGNFLTIPLNMTNGLQNWNVVVGTTTTTTNTFTINTGASWNLTNGPVRFYIWFWVSSTNLA